MAPSSKLKQSSMDSFLLPKPKPSPPIPTPPPAAASDYERLRQETIRRNQDFLQKLGIAAANPRPRQTKRPHKPPPPPASVPLRRSSRRRQSRSDLPSDDDSCAEDAPKESCEPDFVDSSVFQYACDASSLGDPEDPSVISSSGPPEIPSSSAVGFRIVGKTFRDPSLAKIYAIDVCFLKKDRFLIAAGGHSGFVSVYGGDGEEEGGGGGGRSDGETEGPLMSWKSSGSWVSGVKFVEENPMLLISSSNDGRVVVWDVRKQPAVSPSSSPPPPPAVTRSTGLHSGGIFSMDRLGCSIATASKDSSVGISRLTEAGELVAERSVTGHHSGVIRGVCFGEEKDRLADCGADGRICVLDTRLADACALTVESQHSTGINTIEWCKAKEGLILSASKDSELHLYDIRNSSGPVNKLRGHVESHTRTCHQIYRPCFVGGGKTIATPGQGSRKISLYDVDQAKMISQGVIGYDANLVVFTGDSKRPRLWAGGRQINLLSPLI